MSINRISGGMVFAVLFAGGCANPVRPLPPSLHLPDPAKKVTAERVGDEVKLTWTTGPNTTDGDRVRGTITAVVCREMPPAVGCKAVLQMAVAPGASAAAEKLPATLTVGPPVLLAYRVELKNDRGRSDGVGDPVFAAGGAAPAAAGSLRMTPQREAVLIQWSSHGSAATMELKRTLIASGPGAPAVKSGASKAGTKAPQMFAAKPAGDKNDVVLRATGTNLARGDADDPGGLIDPTVRDGDTYSYVAQRVETVTVAGHQLEMRGEASPAATIEYRDVFPPAAPVELVAVPGGGFGQAASIDLAWEAGTENDLLGYNVYRSEGGAFVRLNDEPVVGSAYRDLKVEAGHEYVYRVTAVDARHHESKPGEAIRETLRQ